MTELPAPPTVVITRPRAQAEPLAARLAALGIDARIFPLLEIQPLPAGSAQAAALKKVLDRLADYALVAFVSPNAIDAAFAHISTWPADVIAAVVGDSSRQTLASHGLTDANASVVSPTDPERTDSETLLQVLDLPALRGKKALIVRAETGRELLADRLRDAGIEVEQVAAYRRGAPALDTAGRAQLLSLVDAGAAWVITSSEALRHLQSMLQESAGQGAASAWCTMQRQTLVVPHPRIAETAQSLGFDTVLRTGSGDDALIAAIQAIQSRS
jgi:uroporphyrinogen-III synthase